MVVDHPITDDMAADAPEPQDELRRDRSGLDLAAEDLPDLSDIPSPDDYRAAVDAEYRNHAIEAGCARVREIEQHEITPALRRIEAADPTRHLVGFEHRLKSEDRIEQKVIRAMSERGRSAQEAFGELKDAVRYTLAYPDESYVQGVRSDINRLESQGFELAELRNSWENDEYKGINTRWRTHDSGQVFEVQFHTFASVEAKEQTHEAYERLRVLPPNHEEVHDLRTYQREVSSRIPIPPGIGALDGNHLLRDGR